MPVFVIFYNDKIKNQVINLSENHVIIMKILIYIFQNKFKNVDYNEDEKMKRFDKIIRRNP
jgi:hypothetical protein